VSDTVQDCWLPPPFAFFPFTSPPVRFRVPPDSVSTSDQLDSPAALYLEKEPSGPSEWQTERTTRLNCGGLIMKGCGHFIMCSALH